MVESITKRSMTKCITKGVTKRVKELQRVTIIKHVAKRHNGKHKLEGSVGGGVGEGSPH